MAAPFTNETNEGTNFWRKIAPRHAVASAPKPRHLHSLTIIDSSFYVFGGFGDKGVFFDDFWKYDILLKKWSQIYGVSPPARHSHTAVAFNNQLYVFGGTSGNQALNDIWKFSPKLNQWKAISPSGTKPSGLWGHTAVIDADGMLVWGGMNENSIVSQDLWRFSFRKKTWQKLNTKGTGPSPRQFHSATALEGSMFIFGGYSGSRNFCDFYELKLGSRQWYKLSVDTSLTPRRGTQLLRIGGVICLHSGKDEKGYLKEVWLYNISEQSWRMVTAGQEEKEAPTPRVFHKLVNFGDRIFLFGGLGLLPELSSQKKTGNLNDFYEYSLISRSVQDQKQNQLPKASLGLFSEMHHDIFNYICFSMLDIKDLIRFGACSKSMYQLISNETLWKEKFRGWVHRQINGVDFRVISTGEREFQNIDKPLAPILPYCFWRQKFIETQMTRKGFFWDQTKRDWKKPSLIKLTMLGAGAVGKTSMTVQFTQGVYIHEYDPTIEDSFRKEANVDDERVVFDILDTAGPEEYSQLQNQYLRESDVFLIVYAIDNQDSFSELALFFEKILRVRDSDQVPAVLVGNKCDLEYERQVTTGEGLLLAKEYNVPFYECSAKTRLNIEEVFYAAARQAGYHHVKVPVTPKKKTDCLLQ